MKRLQTIAKRIAVALLLCLPALAQSSQSGAQHFAKDGLAFDYPAEWVLADKSTPDTQHVVITRPGNSALIMVVAYRGPITSFRLLKDALNSITVPYVESVAQKLGATGAPAKPESLCTEVGPLENVEGTKLSGLINKEPTTDEIYSLLMGHRFVNLVYLRKDKDDAQSRLAWDTIRRSLNVDEAATAAAVEPGLESTTPLKSGVNMGGTLNGKALRLPVPDYPRVARAVHAAGIVLVKVMIDEKGEVTSAQALMGHPLLQTAAQEAAKHARFPPTLVCNKPVKTTGIITYNFVAP